MKLIIYTLMTVLGPMLLAAQPDSLNRLNNSFRFENGIYFSFEALARNQADLAWYGIDGEMVELPGSRRVQIENLGYDEAWAESEPFAIVLEGRAFILTKIDSLRGYHEFSGLRELGAIAYYEYEAMVTRGRTMYAYNPVTGRPFRQAYVERERLETLRRCIDWRSGRQFALRRADLLQPLAHEPELIRAISALDPAEPEFYDKLLRAVVRYNERTPVYLPIRPLNR